MNRLGRYFAIFIQQMDLDPAQRVTIEAIETEVENQRYHEKQSDAPRDKCTLSCAINGIHAAFHYLKKNYISGCVMTVPTG